MKDKLRRDKMVEDLEEMTGYPVFGIDVGKDEVEDCPSFFILYTNGPIQRGDANFFVTRDVVLMYVTESDEIDEYAIIKQSPTWGLQFDRTDYDYGKMANTQRIYQFTTFYFTRPVKLGGCYEG